MMCEEGGEGGEGRGSGSMEGTGRYELCGGKRGQLVQVWRGMVRMARTSSNQPVACDLVLLAVLLDRDAQLLERRQHVANVVARIFGTVWLLVRLKGRGFSL